MEFGTLECLVWEAVSLERGSLGKGMTTELMGMTTRADDRLGLLRVQEQ